MPRYFLTDMRKSISSQIDVTMLCASPSSNMDMASLSRCKSVYSRYSLRQFPPRSDSVAQRASVLLSPRRLWRPIKVRLGFRRRKVRAQLSISICPWHWTSGQRCTDQKRNARLARTQAPHISARMRGFANPQLLTYQGTMPLFEWPEGPLSRNGGDDLKIIPGFLAFLWRLRLQQVYRVHGSSVRPNCNLTVHRILCGRRFHGCDDRSAVIGLANLINGFEIGEDA